MLLGKYELEDLLFNTNFELKAGKQDMMFYQRERWQLYEYLGIKERHQH